MAETTNHAQTAVCRRFSWLDRTLVEVAYPELSRRSQSIAYSDESVQDFQSATAKDLTYPNLA